MTQNTVTAESGAQRRIVVGVDSSDNATRAAVWAAREASERGVALCLVHALDLPGAMGMVIEPVGYAQSCRRDGQNLLDRVAASLHEQHPDLVVTTDVSDLGAAETMVTMSGNAQLVVTGTRGHGGFAGMLLGSVSLALAAHAQCPIVVVRGEVPGEALNEVVLGVGTGQAEAPIRFAFHTAAKLGAALTVVRAWDPGSADTGYYHIADIPKVEHQAATEVADLIEVVRADYPDVVVTAHVIRGNPVTVLINAAGGARMLVVGAHRRRSVLSVGAGYVAQGLLAHSPTPVAVVPIG